MSVPNPIRRPAALLLAVAAPACARPARGAPVPRPGTHLERVAELPAAPAAPFGRACAMRLRDAATGREYLIVRSETRTTAAAGAAGASTAVALASAVGDYAPVSADGPPGPPVARLRVDCATSRVLSALAPGA